MPATSSSSSAPAIDTSDRKPCSRPTAMSGFLKLNSASTTADGTSLSISFVDCTVDPANDEDISYTPTSSTTVLVRAGAQVEVLQPDNNVQTVAADWLVDHQVVGTPYFYYQEDAQHQITALQEIYHP